MGRLKNASRRACTCGGRGKIVAGKWFDLAFDIPANQVFTYRADEKGNAAVGKRALAPFGKRGRDSLGYIIAERETPPQGIDEAAIKPIRRVADAAPVFDGRGIELARWIAAYYLCGIGQAISAMIPSGRRMVTYSSFGGSEELAETDLELSAEQKAALDAILGTGDCNSNYGVALAPCSDYGTKTPVPSPQSPVPEMYYLYGITGSGKTEVFLRAAEHMIKEGKSVIYLVPEIALTRQTAELIGRRFGSAAATLHSGMSPSERLAEWSRVMRGEAPIVAGPRSAVFAPVPNLGLVIIDEEHDGSYKSGNTPRYHARQTAIHRCAADGAKLVMGSATPSAEAWKLMAEGKIKRLDLSLRLAGGSLPEIKAVSLDKTEGCLTSELKEEIRLTAQMGRQTILFLNRRGFAHFYHCPSCGYEQKCKRCSVSLTWHKSRNRAMCHYCGYYEAPPDVCPRCGSLEAGYRGFGTEMVEEEVRRTFPNLRIRRIDADAAGKKGVLEDTISLFKAGLIDILLGTQMVAKGLNFPGVHLVGVVFADTGLHLPDFRAAERTFSLIVQVAGRAGRYFPDGKVIVQTFRMDDPVITRSCAIDVKGFFDAELAQREALNFPPYTRLIRISARSRNAARADAAIKRLADLAASGGAAAGNSAATGSGAASLIPYGADMLGPAECPIGIINGNHRRHLILRGKSMGTLHAAARILLERYEKGRDSQVYLEVDVDPVNVL
jgi:primosomal protein N' (replication factor Y)